MSSNILLNMLKDFYDKKEYSEIIDISCYLDISSLPVDILEIIAVSAFRLRLHSSCIAYCQEYIARNEKHYLIFEIFGESLYQQNMLEESLVYYKQALALRPSLKVAKHRVFSLEYRLNKIVNFELLQEVKKLSIKESKINYLRSVAYILVDKGLYDEALECFKEIFLKDRAPYYMDYHLFLNSKYLIERCEDHYLMGLEHKKNSVGFQYRLEEYNRDTLFISLAPGDKYIFQKYQYNADKLFITDNSMSYYSLTAKKIADLIQDLIREKRYKKISIVGSSKGGTGVFFILSELDKRNLEVEIKAVAFSPQVSIYPFNSNLTIPSYVTLFSNLECNRFLLEEFSKNGQFSLNFISDIKLTVFYGNKFSMDKREIEYLPANNHKVDIVSLNFSGHVSMIPLTIPENKSSADLKKSYSHLSIDPDMEALGGRNLVNIVDEIFEIYSDPNMRLHKFLC